MLSQTGARANRLTNRTATGAAGSAGIGGGNRDQLCCYCASEVG